MHIYLIFDIIIIGTQDTKITKMSTTRLLQKRLAQKEIHEQKKQKRHDDRMVMEQKLIDVLTKHLEK